jgi:hypothetical protein
MHAASLEIVLKYCRIGILFPSAYATLEPKGFWCGRREPCPHIPDAGRREVRFLLFDPAASRQECPPAPWIAPCVQESVKEPAKRAAGELFCPLMNALLKERDHDAQSNQDQRPDEQFFSYVAALLIGRALQTCR